MQTKLKVEGMSCSHCEKTVKKAVSAIDGVSDVAVDLKNKTVTVSHDENVTFDMMKNEIEEQGYDVIDVIA